MKAKEFIPASKPRNFVAKNAPTSGAGRHKDSSKKKDQEQGKVKHKKDLVPMEGFTQAHADKNKIKNQKSGAIGHGLGWKNYGDNYKTLVSDIVDKFDNITRLAQYFEASESTKYKIVERFFKKYGYPFELFNDVIIGIEKRVAGETRRYRREGTAEGWSDAMVSRRTGQPRTPYSVYIKGKKWKDFENDDHAEAVANKLKAKFKADGRDPETITIAPTDMPEGMKEQQELDELTRRDFLRGAGAALGGAALAGVAGSAGARVPINPDPNAQPYSSPTPKARQYKSKDGTIYDVIWLDRNDPRPKGGRQVTMPLKSLYSGNVDLPGNATVIVFGDTLYVLPKSQDETATPHASRESIASEATALEKFRKAADEREKKHAAAEKEMKARHARGEEDMKGSIDRLEKHLDKK